MIVLKRARDQRLAKEASVIEQSPVKEGFDSSRESQDIKYDEIKFGHLICIPRFFFGLVSQILVTASIQFMAPAFSVHMQKYGFTPGFIGICFAIPGVIYAALSPLMYLFT